MRNSFYRLRSFIGNNEGGVMVMAAFFIVVLLALAGAGIDFGRAYLLKMKLQEATDLAALAAANPASKNPSPKDRKDSANMYYNLNFPSKYLGVTRPPFQYTPTAVNITVGDSTSINTNFIRTMGSQFDSLKVSSRSRVNIRSGVPKYDVILVLDKSDSMDWTFAGEICDKSLGSINGVLSGVPHDDCNPTVNNNYTPPNPSTCYNPTTADYHHCADKSRIDGLKLAANTFADILLDNNVVENNRIALVTWNHLLQSRWTFSNNLDEVKKNINSIKAIGGTNSTLGLEKAKEYSNSFKSDAIHAVVLLTDGLNTGASSPAKHDPNIDNASLAICNYFKNMDPATVVYTIAVGDLVKKDSSGKFIHATEGPLIDDFMSKCASGTPGSNLNQYYFITAGDASQLATVFKTIATSIQELRITD